MALARALKTPDITPDVTLTHDAEPEFTYGWRVAASATIPLFTTHKAAVVGDTVYAALADALGRPGLFLVGGLSGSGRTTTLYAALRELAGSGAVLTIEDPVDWAVPGVDQTEVNPRAALTYASGLHALLQADADAVAVGELVDAETARLATLAAFTQPVLTTVEGDNAASTVRRLLDLGVKPPADAFGVVH